MSKLSNERQYGSQWSEVATIAAMTAALVTNPAVAQPVVDDFKTNTAVAAYEYVSESELAAQEQEEAAFLAFLDEQMERYPELVTPLDEDQLERIAQLVAKVEI